MATSSVGMAGASPQAWCVIAGAWTTVTMVVTRLPGHPLTAEVGDRCVLGPVEQLGGKPGLTPLPGAGYQWGGQRQGLGRREGEAQQWGSH